MQASVSELKCGARQQQQQQSREKEIEIEMRTQTVPDRTDKMIFLRFLWAAFFFSLRFLRLL